MSATNRGGLDRHAHDFYETPLDAIDLALDALGIGSEFSGYVIDAGSGTGHIAHRLALRAPRADVRGVELQAELIARAKQTRAPTIAWTQADWLSWEGDGSPELVIGNPPYQKTRFDPAKVIKKNGKPTGELGGVVIVDPHLAERFIRKALAFVGKKGRVAMLLRDNFMLPKTRRALRADFGMPDRHGLEKRPSFNGSGTDACDYAWHCWGPKQSGKWTVLSSR